MLTGRTAVVAALAAALLFGARPPLARLLTGETSPVLLAGLLYLGSGLGLWGMRLVRTGRISVPTLEVRNWLFLSGATIAGGVIAPVSLMYGLTQISASVASLLLNLETVFTALVAWFVFRESADRRLVFGMMLIIAGSAVLAWPPNPAGAAANWGALFVVAACICWALDNNLTREVSAVDADFIAATKGLVAGITNVALAVWLHARLPPPNVVIFAAIIGLFGYGVSLTLFVLALRELGSARAGAYFATAPFLGAAIAVIVLHDSTPPGFWVSALLMVAGVVMSMTERHSHEHTHAPLAHEHYHFHDLHHQHDHEFPWDKAKPHSHPHRHELLTHDHAHFPDLHHRHAHACKTRTG